MRVFYDRLIEAVDKEWLVNKIKACVREHFKENFDIMLSSLLPDGQKEVSLSVFFIF